MNLEYSDYDITVWSERWEGRIWLHSRVRRWNKDVYRRCVAAFRHIQALHRCDLWVCDNDFHLAPNLPRSISRLGFVPAELKAHQGMIRTCFVSRFSVP